MSNDAVPSGLEPWLLAYVAEQAQPDRVEVWVERVTGAILEEMAELRQVEGVEPLLRLTVREHWVAFLADFAQQSQHFRLVEAAQRLAAVIAQLQVPLETLIQIYRVAQQEVWAYVSEVIKDLPPSDFDRADLLIYFWNRAGVWLDRSISVSIEIYQTERTKLVAGVDAQRYEIVQAVLAGQLDDPRRISSALGGYPISAHHTALALACDDDDAIARLEQVAFDLARSVGSGNPLLVRPGGRRLWVWVATRDPISTEILVETFNATKRGTTVVGVGTPSHGVRGFADSHTEALGALQVIGSRTTARINVYADVELLVLLGCGPEVDRFVARTLGGLIGEDESAQRVRETVDAYLASGGSVDEASRQLVVHRNTIRYRLGQAEELLGRPIGKISTEVFVALRHLSAFHPDGLTTPK